jgi:CRP-like cAMP-binding protein
MDEKQLENLKAVSILQLLAVEELKEFSEIMRHRKYLAGQKIFAQGESGDSMFIVKNGSVKVSLADKEVFLIASGGFFGEIALFDRTPRTASVEAIEDSTLWEINRDDFAGLISKFPYVGIKVMFRIIQDMSKRLQRMNKQV